MHRIIHFIYRVLRANRKLNTQCLLCNKVRLQPNGKQVNLIPDQQINLVQFEFINIYLNLTVKLLFVSFFLVYLFYIKPLLTYI